jgi:heme-degrading monooxygenase HmoA
MFAVIFVVEPKKQRWNDYLELAKQLKPKLEACEGFIDNERFESKRRKGHLLSLSTWRDEKAVVRWRTHGEHHGIQEKGRAEVFENYRLRVGEITADTESAAGSEQQRFDETQTGDAKAVTITEVTPHDDRGVGAEPDGLLALLGLSAKTAGLLDHEVFESIYNPGKLVLLASWRDSPAAEAWAPARLPAAKHVRHRRVRIIRDYGMFERAEAPQYYPEVKRAEADRRQAGRAASG